MHFPSKITCICSELFTQRIAKDGKLVGKHTLLWLLYKLNKYSSYFVYTIIGPICNSSEVLGFPCTLYPNLISLLDNLVVSSVLQVKTVKISNISLAASEQDIREFFSFSGDIQYLEMQRLFSFLFSSFCVHLLVNLLLKRRIFFFLSHLAVSQMWPSLLMSLSRTRREQKQQGFSQ